MSITSEEMEVARCKKIHWNPNYNGGHFEYYFPVKGDGRGIKDVRLSFIPTETCPVWLVLPGYKYALPHVKNFAQFRTMYELLTGKSIATRPAAGAGEKE